MTIVWVLNGPNLGRLGTRDPKVYGSTTHDELAEGLVEFGRTLDQQVQVRQTDSEATMLGWLHAAAADSIPVVLNAGAWSHYSYAVADAAAMRTAALVEVHISNIHAREEFRHRSVISAHASGVIVGLGVEGYRLALRAIASQA